MPEYLSWTQIPIKQPIDLCAWMWFKSSVSVLNLLKRLLLPISPWWSVAFILRSGVVKVPLIVKIVRKANDAMHGCSVTRPFVIHMCTGPCSSSCPDVFNIQFMIYVNAFLQCAVKGVHQRSTGNQFMLEECMNYQHKDTLYSSKYVSINFWLVWFAYRTPTSCVHQFCCFPY